MKHLLAFCESARGEALAALETLVRLESPSTDKAAVDRCGREAADRLAAIGGRVRTIVNEASGNCVIAEFGEQGRPILLLGHLDTVWPVGQLERMPWRVADGRVHGPGVFDMKGGIVMALLALRALVQLSPRPLPRVTLLLTGDEETGSRASRGVIEAEARSHEAVLVLEPALPGGALKTARKGCGEYELRVRGVAAHAGIEPEKGASAVLELAEQLLAVERLQDPRKGTTVNAGVVQGGARANVVPDEAHAIIDARAASMAEARRIDAGMRALVPARKGTSLSVSGGFDRPPLERTAGVRKLFEQARGVAAELGFDLHEGATGGGSDGNFTAALGVPTLDGLGAEGDGAHAAHEHLLLERVAPRAALVAGLLVRLGAN